MEYNKIHEEFRLLMGLKFSLHFDLPSYPDKWVVKSNIPELDYTVLSSKGYVDAIEEVILILQTKFSNYAVLLSGIDTRKKLINILNKYKNESNSNDTSTTGNDFHVSPCARTNSK